MAVTLINYTVQRVHIASVHKAGCKDIRKDAWKHGSDHPLYFTDYPDLETALSSYIDAEMLEMGWSREDVRVFPCAKGH